MKVSSYKDFNESSKKCVTFIGDIMFHRHYIEHYSENDMTHVFKNLKKIFNESDFVIGNLETTFSGFSIATRNKIPKFSAPDKFAIALKKLGITHLTLTNNHIFDFGIEGFERTKNVLTGVGITPIVDKAVIDNINAVCFTEKVNTPDIDNVTVFPFLRDSSRLNFALVHWGGQFTETVNEKQLEICKKLKTGGYRVVIGTGPHYDQKIEIEEDFLVAYSLGNFTSCHLKGRDEGKILQLFMIDEKICKIVEHSLIINNKNDSSIIEIIDTKETIKI